jgi:hypothetical protein
VNPILATQIMYRGFIVMARKTARQSSPQLLKTLMQLHRMGVRALPIIGSLIEVTLIVAKVKLKWQIYKATFTQTIK